MEEIIEIVPQYFELDDNGFATVPPNQKIVKVNKEIAAENDHLLKSMGDGDETLLCSICRVYGYCFSRYYKDPKTNKLIKKTSNTAVFESLITPYNTSPITDREISNQVNVRTEMKESNTQLGNKLQGAHDLFHQDEFEQASYMYLDIIETRNDCKEAWRGICASFYFLGKYEEASAACLNAYSSLDSSFINRFIKGCEKKIEEVLKNESVVKNEIDKETLVNVLF
jgi:hypothetical protein